MIYLSWLLVALSALFGAGLLMLAGALAESLLRGDSFLHWFQ